MKQRPLFNKLIIRFSLEILVPFILLLLLFMMFSNHQQLENDIMQNEIVKMQTLNSIQQKTMQVEKMCSTVAQNQSIINFLNKKYDKSNDLGYYQTTIRNFVSTTNGISDIRLKIYMENPTIPMGFGIFYPIDFIRPNTEFSQFYSSSGNDIWLHLSEGEQIIKYDSSNQSDYYHYFCKIKTATDCIAVIEASVPKNCYNVSSPDSDMLIQPIELENCYLYNYTDYELTSEQIQSLKENCKNETLIATVHENDTLPFPVMVVTERSRLSYNWNFTFFLFVAMFTTMTLTFFFYNKRFVGDVHSCLDVMEAAISNNFEVSPDCKFSNEIIQRNDELSVLALRINYLLQEMRTSLEKEVKQQTITKEAQLSALQHQINPHFLYNTMEIFSSRIELSGLYEESDAISAFCRMLRYNINTKDLMSTVGNEINQIKYYLTIQKLRGIPFEVDFNIHEILYKAQIIRFIFIPFIENSFEYRGSASPLRIEISAELKGACIEITIQNNGEPIPEERLEQLNSLFTSADTELKTSGQHVGLKNINSRLKLFYGNAHHIHVESNNEQTTFRFLIPDSTSKMNNKPLHLRQEE